MPKKNKAIKTVFSYIVIIPSIIFLLLLISIKIYVYMDNKAFEGKYEKEQRAYYDNMISFKCSKYEYEIPLENYKNIFYIKYKGNPENEYVKNDIRIKINEDGIIIYKKGEIFEKISMDRINDYIIENLSGNDDYKDFFKNSIRIYDIKKMTMVTGKTKIFIKKIVYPRVSKKLADLDIELYIK